MNFLMAAAFLRNKKKKLMNKNRKLKEKVANPKIKRDDKLGISPEYKNYKKK